MFYYINLSVLSDNLPEVERLDCKFQLNTNFKYLRLQIFIDEKQRNGKITV